MSAPHRFEVHLKPSPRDTIERRLDGDDTWVDTGISEDSVYDGTGGTWRDLLERFDTIEEIEEIERDLTGDLQQRVGRVLHRALFGQTRWPGDRWLHIVPEKPHDIDQTRWDSFFDLVLRLPWTLLTDEDSDSAAFLVLDPVAPVSITLDAAPGRGRHSWFKDIRLPLVARILLAIPILEQGGKPTEGPEHLEAVRAALAAACEARGLAAEVRHVGTFQEFEAAIRGREDPAGDRLRFDPHVIYFYGHADTVGADTMLLFDPDARGKSEWHGIDEVRRILDDLFQRTQFPPFVWVNACKGGAAARNSVLRRLSPVASTVITTRTLATVRDSRALAERALPMITVDGRAPHSALRETIRKLPADAVRSARWATTVIAAQYELWSALGTEARQFEDRESAGDVPLRMDRKQPIARIEGYLAKVLSDGEAAAPHVVLWHGRVDHGLDAFERRFDDLVVERFPSWCPIIRRVELQAGVKPNRPPGVLDPHFLTSVFEALRGTRVSLRGRGIQVQGIRSALATLVAARRSLLVLSHGPFEEAHRAGLIDYIDFWNRLYPLLDLGRTESRVLIGLGFSEASPVLLAADDSALAVQLEDVPLPELTEHLQRFGELYGVSPASVTAEWLIDDNNGAFRPIYNWLGEKLAIREWQNQQDRPRA